MCNSSSFKTVDHCLRLQWEDAPGRSIQILTSDHTCFVYNRFTRSTNTATSTAKVPIHFVALFYFLFYLFIYLFLAVLRLRFCARAFSSCGKRGPLPIAVRGPLTIAASLVAEHRLQMRRLSSCGSRAQLLCGMWDPPRPGLEPMSPALAGRLSTTVPPGKPCGIIFNVSLVRVCACVS